MTCGTMSRGTHTSVTGKSRDVHYPISLRGGEGREARDGVRLRWRRGAVRSSAPSAFQPHLRGWGRRGAMETGQVNPTGRWDRCCGDAPALRGPGHPYARHVVTGGHRCRCSPATTTRRLGDRFRIVNHANRTSVRMQRERRHTSCERPIRIRGPHKGRIRGKNCSQGGPFTDLSHSF